LCGKDMQPGVDRMFVVKIEIIPVHDPNAITEADLEDDNLEAVSDVLQSESHLDDLDSEPRRNRQVFDLCPECKVKYLRDPLNRDLTVHLNFSEN